MAYTTALKVFQSMERIGEAEETFSSVSNGDTLELANRFIVKDAYPSESKTVILSIGGTEQSSTDYSINFEQNEIDYTGTASGDATVEYKYGPYNNSVLQTRVNAVTEYIDDYTNSTYDGRATVTDEVYDGGGSHHDTYVFDKRPVREVSKVELNQPKSGTNPDYKTVDEGLGNDYIKYKTLGIRFLPEGDNPSNDPEDVRVSYTYGYSGMPADLEVAATEMVIDDLIRGTVSGAMVDGRDNFDPQTVNVQSSEWREVLDRYRIERMNNFTNLALEGSIS